MRVHPLRWKATRRFSSSRAAFARRLTGHERRPPEETCELVVGPTRSSSIFVRALSMSCTLLSHRSCSVVESDCSKAITCGLWDTNALNLQRRRRPRMLFCGIKGPLTPNNSKAVVRNLVGGARGPGAISRGNKWSEEGFCHAGDIEAPGNCPSHD